MIIRKLKNHPHAQCHVEGHDDGTIVFVSYQTPVLKIDNGLLCPIQSGKYWDGRRIYTPTTAQQISAFLKEYVWDIDYPAFKHAALHDKDIWIDGRYEEVE